MKNWINILLMFVLFSCGSADLGEAYKYAPIEVKTEIKHEFNEGELNEYLAVKLKDIQELQEVLHNPELNAEMKSYAKDMILKIIPEDKLLLEENKIIGFSRVNVKRNSTNGFLGEHQKTIPISSFVGLKVQSDTIEVKITSSTVGNEVSLSFEILD